MGYWFDCLIKFGLISSAWECLPCWHSPAWRRHGEAAAACEICTELTIMETEQCQCCRSGVCIFGFEPISCYSRPPLLVLLLMVLRG